MMGALVVEVAEAEDELDEVQSERQPVPQWSAVFPH